MSTLHASQNLTIPKNLHKGVATKRPLRPQRTEISPLYQRASDENTTNQNQSSSKLEPADADVLSLDLLNQYNDIVGPKESLAFKRLPPVKVSYQSTKHKFVESPHIEGTSRIIRPHLSMKTYSPGHHIFTEGISKSSIMRSPTFALQRVGVPYSNLPDSISVYKEKDKFAFGVKSGEYEKSPYRLTPKPLKLGSATFIPALDAESEKSNMIGDKFLKAKRGSKPNIERQFFEVKSNVIKLEPLFRKDTKEGKADIKTTEFSTDIVKIPAGFTRPAKSPLAPSNSFYATEPEQERMADINVQSKDVKEAELEDKTLQVEKQERKLSVVSIGETVGPSFYESKKREARQQYPIFDHASRQNESYRKKKFEYSDDFIFKAKPHVPSSTFTYKVSMQGMTFLQDKSPDRFKPIRNNLRDRSGHVIHKQRGLGRYRATSEEDLSKGTSDYNFRRYYRRVFRRPKSSDSHSTEFSQLPGNPPPSEISHIISEDAPLLINDVRNGMVTLIEERTMTAASIITHRIENTPIENAGDNTKEVQENPGSKLSNLEDNETCTDTDIQFENALRNFERHQEQDIDTARTDIAYSVIDKSKEPESARTMIESSSKCDSSIVEQYIAEAEERIKSISDAEDTEKKRSQTLNVDLISQSNKTSKLDTIDENQSDKKKTQSKLKGNGNKQCLAVPTLSLDSASHHPDLDITKERTSLSRTIQNMKISEDDLPKNAHKEVKHAAVASDETNGDNKTRKEIRSTLPVTRLRLFSDTSTISVKAPSFSVTDENGELHEVLDNDLDDSKATDFVKEKKVINNANVPFIYPATSEVKAKRQ